MEPKEYVAALLKKRNKMLLEIAALRYELEQFTKIGDEAIIQELNFPGGFGEAVNIGAITDRTADVALKYHQVAERLNNEALKAIVNRLDTLETAVKRLEFYIGQLSEEQAEVLRRYFFDCQTWRDLQIEMSLTVKTLRKLRDSAVALLVERYTLLFSLSVVTEDELNLFL